MKYYLKHYGVPGQKWGVRKDDDDDPASFMKRGKSILQGYDGYDESDDYNGYATNPHKAEQYVYSWHHKYGSIPVNRLRYEYNDDRYSSGSQYVSDFDWNRTSLDNIYDSYREYRESEDWD